MAYFASFSCSVSAMILVIGQVVSWLTSFLGRRISSVKGFTGVKVAECTMHVGQEGEKSPSVMKRLLFKDCVNALVNTSGLSALC